jgi:outer membrane receptor for ferrienterochelin and colicins
VQETGWRDARGIELEIPLMRPALPLIALLPLVALLAPLAQAQQALPPVVVSATRSALPLLLAPASMSVLRSEDVARLGSDNLLQLLRLEPSIQAFGRPIGGRKALSLRGMDPRHTLILVDGQRVSASDGLVGGSDFQLDWVGAADVARVEVVRGPMSVLYGPEALGGVIQVFTQPLPDQWQGQALVEARNGSQGADGHRVGLAVRGPLSETLRLGASLSDARRASTPGLADARITAVEGRQPREAALKLVWQPEAAHRVSLDARRAREQRWLDTRERSGLRRYHQSLHWLDRDRWGAAWDADWQGGLSTRLQAYRSSLAVRNIKTDGVASLRPNTLHDSVLEGQWVQARDADLQLTAGFEWRDEEVLNSGLQGGRGAAQHRGAFAQLEWQAEPALRLTGGLRGDHHSRFGSFWSPRAYAVWQAAPGWVLKGGVSRGFKAPSVKQNDANYREDEGPHTYLGNDSLRPEQATSVEAALAWDGRDAAASATLFRNRVGKLINTRLIGGTPARGTYVFENLDRAVVQGVEWQAGWRPAPGWNLQAQAVWMRARDAAGQPLEKRAERSATLRADYGNALWGAGMAWNRQCRLHLASGVAGQAPVAVPSVQGLQAQAHWRFAEGFTLRAGVDNLENQRLSTLSPLFSYEELPRTWRLSVEGRW